jgi:NhaP-type Na+/H+ or K+/H+ antiporter
MVFDFAEVLLLGLLADWVFRMCRLPGLVGMMLVGLLLGPNLLGLISHNLLDIGVELRLLALVVLLLRAGLRLDRGALREASPISH